MAKRTVEEIQVLFPAPRRVDEVPGGYCVGGAFLSACDETYVGSFFPSVEVVAKGLQRENAALSKGKAFDYAMDITRCNDRGDFESAWGWLRMALAERKPTKRREDAGKQ